MSQIASTGQAAQASADGIGQVGRRVPTFFWDAAGVHSKGRTVFQPAEPGNFGDLIGPEFIHRLAGHEAFLAKPSFAGRRLFTVGSVLHRARDGDVIWGTGLKGSAAAFDPSVRSLDIRAVRGPITFDFLRRRGFDLGRVTQLFDPGSLIARLLPEIREAAAAQEKRPFIIIPHIRDVANYTRNHPKLAEHLVTPWGTPASVALRIAGAERVISASLHGIIVAESLGVPAVWLAPVGGEDELKYTDYYLGTDRYKIQRARSVEAALKAEPMPLPKLDVEAMLASFPHDAIDGLLVEAR